MEIRSIKEILSIYTQIQVVMYAPSEILEESEFRRLNKMTQKLHQELDEDGRKSLERILEHLMQRPQNLQSKCRWRDLVEDDWLKFRTKIGPFHTRKEIVN